MFNVGDKVKCISRDNALHKDQLTIGKIYEIQPSPSFGVTVINDQGVSGAYYEYRFELVSTNSLVDNEFLEIDFIEIAKDICNV
jgi:hypothetical protein